MVRNIVLTGFMGTGKSSVGKELSTIRNIGFIDTDEEITKQFGSINELFENHGEEYFRQCEREIIIQVAKSAEVVIATGGGAVMDPDNIKVLEASGEIICLTANPEEVVNRLTSLERLGFGHCLMLTTLLMQFRHYWLSVKTFTNNLRSLTLLGNLLQRLLTR